MVALKVFFATALLAFIYGAANSINLEINIQNLLGQQELSVATDPAKSPLALQENDPNTCRECHQEFKFNGTVSVHEPFANGQCSYCHSSDPHDQQTSRTVQEQIDLCYSCHPSESLGYSHPVGEGTIDANTGEPITCGTCHPAHYSNKSHLLELDGRGELCVHCHTEFLNSP